MANYDETEIVFKWKACSAYFPNEDATNFTGFREVSLTSISSNGIDLAKNSAPYYPGILIDLNIHTKSEDIFPLESSYQNKMPAGIPKWSKDNYLEDSIGTSNNKYSFTVSATDTNSLVNKKFDVKLKESTQ
jgi:hypothetical protein